MYFDKPFEFFRNFSYPEGYVLDGDYLYFGADRAGYFVYRHGYTYFYLDTPPYELLKRVHNQVAYEKIFAQEIGWEEKQKVIDGYITPWFWEQFLEETKDFPLKKKFSWLYQNTGRKGLVIISDDGVLFPKKLLFKRTVEGKGVVYIYDENNYFYYQGRLYPLDYHGYMHNGEWYPFEIFISTFSICDECGIVHNNYSDPNICHTCSAKYKIQEYHAKAEDQLLFKNAGEPHPVYLGIELEYEDCKDKARDVIKLFDKHVIIKRDGSINYGFEIVTCPATLAVHKEAFKNFFKNTPYLKKKRNCGMHVHIDKSTLGEMQRGKMLTFLTDPDNKKFLTILAGRAFTDNHYCQAKEKLPITYGVEGNEDYVKRTGTNKYSALNMQKNATLEIRIFAPPKTYGTFMRRMEFVQALVDWTRPAVIGVNEVNLTKFKAFIDKHNYPYLKKFMEKF